MNLCFIKWVFIFLSVNDSLPIDITGAQVQQYPELACLLSELSQRITADGVSLHVKQELQQVSLELAFL
jgi:hypothetical protein